MESAKLIGSAEINQTSEMDVGANVHELTLAGGAVRQADNTDVETAASSLNTSLRRVSEASTREIGSLVDEFHGLQKKLETDVFGRATSPGEGNHYLRLIEGAAESLSVSVIAAPVQGADDVQQAVASLAVDSNTGLIITPDATTTGQRKLIIDAVAAHRIPAIYPYRFMSEEGGLASYGVDVTDLYRRAAGYVDRILRGENPSELPVQAPTKFEFVINLTTAKALELTIPASLMSLADELIE
jgi:hypothetical protein